MKISKEHGLNPTLSICIVCGKETGEIALLGDTYKGEAPKNMVTSIEPCKDCKNKYLKAGILLVECDYDKNPTNKLMIIKESAFKKIFNQKSPVSRICLVEQGLLNKIS